MAGPMRWAICLQLFASAAAQIVSVDGTPVPEAKMMAMIYTFYVIAKRDIGSATSGVLKWFEPDPRGIAHVHFHDVHASFVPNNLDALGAAGLNAMHPGVQLSLVRFTDLFAHLNPDHFCCASKLDGRTCEQQGDLRVELQDGEEGLDAAGICLQNVALKEGGGRIGGSKEAKMNIETTDVYVLVLSNCGVDLPEASLHGRVAVTGPYGYLPGNEYPKLPFYKVLSIVYTVLALIWTLLSARYWQTLVSIQHCVAGVIVLGLIECSTWGWFFHAWNADGTRSHAFFALAIFGTVSKHVFSYMLVLVASLGWGVTRPYLDAPTVSRIRFIIVFFIVFGVARETALSYRGSHSLPVPLVALLVIPTSLLNAVIFYWVFSALSSLIATLQERQQEEKLRLFQRLWLVLVIALLSATLAAVVWIFDLSSSAVVNWQGTWVYSDAVSHLLFLAVLVAIMVLWAPGERSTRYAFSTQLESTEAKAHSAAVLGATEQWEEGEEEDDDFWSATRAPGLEPKNIPESP